MKQPEYQHCAMIVLDRQTGYQRIRKSDEECSIGDVVVDTRGAFVISGVASDTQGRARVVMTCISTPANS